MASRYDLLAYQHYLGWPCIRFRHQLSGPDVRLTRNRATLFTPVDNETYVVEKGNSLIEVSGKRLLAHCEMERNHITAIRTLAEHELRLIQKARAKVQEAERRAKAVIAEENLYRLMIDQLPNDVLADMPDIHLVLMMRWGRKMVDLGRRLGGYKSYSPFDCLPETLEPDEWMPDELREE